MLISKKSVYLLTNTLVLLYLQMKKLYNGSLLTHVSHKANLMCSIIALFVGSTTFAEVQAASRVEQQTGNFLQVQTSNRMMAASDADNPSPAVGQIELHLDAPGKLHQLIGERKKYKITNLKLTGVVGSSDVMLLRDMAGSDVKGNPTDGKLSRLDLSEATLVADGDQYLKRDGACYMVNNVVNYWMFSNCRKLKEILLPDNVRDIRKGAFSGCAALERINLPEGLISIGESAFYGCEALRRLCIPSSVKCVGKNAFYGVGGEVGCDVECESENPPYADHILFSVSNHITLRVSRGNLSAYSISNWGDASRLVESNL